jgi:hypothetical protein
MTTRQTRCGKESNKRDERDGRPRPRRTENKEVVAAARDGRDTVCAETRPHSSLRQFVHRHRRGRLKATLGTSLVKRDKGGPASRSEASSGRVSFGGQPPPLLVRHTTLDNRRQPGSPQFALAFDTPSVLVPYLFVLPV